VKKQKVQEMLQFKRYRGLPVNLRGAYSIGLCMRENTASVTGQTLLSRKESFM